MARDILHSNAKNVDTRILHNGFEKVKKFVILDGSPWVLRRAPLERTLALLQQSQESKVHPENLQTNKIKDMLIFMR